MENKRKIRNRFISAFLRSVRFKLGPFEFHGPALLIYPIELILIVIIITAIVLIFRRPQIILDILEAIGK